MAAAHYFDFPYCVVFAVLGRHFHTLWQRSAFCQDGIWPASATGDQLAVLSVIPVGFFTALHIAVGFGRGAVWLAKRTTLIWELGTLWVYYGLWDRAAPAQRGLAIIAGLIIALIAAILWKGAIKPADITFPAANSRNHLFPGCLPPRRSCSGDLWGGKLTHLSSEFKKSLNVIFRAHCSLA